MCVVVVLRFIFFYFYFFFFSCSFSLSHHAPSSTTRAHFFAHFYQHHTQTFCFFLFSLLFPWLIHSLSLFLFYLVFLASHSIACVICAVHTLICTITMTYTQFDFAKKMISRMVSKHTEGEMKWNERNKQNWVPSEMWKCIQLLANRHNA